MKRRKEKVRFTVTTRIALFPPLFRSQLVITSRGAARRGDEVPSTPRRLRRPHPVSALIASTSATTATPSHHLTPRFDAPLAASKGWCFDRD